MKCKSLKVFVLIGVFIILSVLEASSIWAQAYPPGFDFRIEWEHFEEQSKDRREVDVMNIGARVGYTLPQTLDLYLALSWQDMDARLPDPNGVEAYTHDLDPALAFRIGAKVYVLRGVPMGLPADFTISLSYNTAKHHDDKSKLKFTHRRIVGAGGLEWRYMHSTPYLSLGILYSELDTTFENFDQTSLIFAGGIYLQLIENVYIKTELNWCQEVGYVLGVQYRF